MSPKILNFCGVGAILAMTACSQPEPQSPVITPVYDKVGNVAACVGSDGRDYPVPQPGTVDVYGEDGRNPCNPGCTDPEYHTASQQWVCRPPEEECENGFFDQTGQWQCRPDDDGGDDTPQPRDPQEPTGAVN